MHYHENKINARALSFFVSFFLFLLSKCDRQKGLQDYLVDDAFLFVLGDPHEFHGVPRHFAAFQGIVGLVHRLERAFAQDFVELKHACITGGTTIKRHIKRNTPQKSQMNELPRHHIHIHSS